MLNRQLPRAFSLSELRSESNIKGAWLQGQYRNADNGLNYQLIFNIVFPLSQLFLGMNGIPQVLHSLIWYISIYIFFKTARKVWLVRVCPSGWTDRTPRIEDHKIPITAGAMEKYVQRKKYLFYFVDKPHYREKELHGKKKMMILT